MKLHDFLDIKYRNNTVERQKNYSFYKDGVTNAITGIAGIYRSASKFVAIFVLLGEFLFVRLGLTDPPNLLDIPKPHPAETSQKPTESISPNQA